MWKKKIKLWGIVFISSTLLLSIKFKLIGIRATGYKGMKWEVFQSYLPEIIVTSIIIGIILSLLEEK